MASTILSKLYPQMQQSQSEPPTTQQSNPSLEQVATGGFTNLANQIMSSIDPNAAFQKIIGSSPDAQKGMEIVQQYGNGDPKAAFMNYMAAQGKQALGQQILSKLGLFQF